VDSVGQLLSVVVCIYHGGNDGNDGVKRVLSSDGYLLMKGMLSLVILLIAGCCEHFNDTQSHH
jgi:hypothetical protein